MTDYTERFRTLSIPQMQRLLWVCCTYIAKRDAVQAHRIETILAPPTPFNVDPADEALVDAAMAKPKPASEPVAPAVGGERAIVVGSTWAFNGNEDRVILSLDPIEVGIPGPVKVPHGTWKDEAVFRKLYTWVSDPAPPQQPAERVTTERDAALATVAKLTAELEAARLESDKLIATLRQQYDGCCDANDGLVEELSTTRARLAETQRELESVRAGLDPKECGELIATVRGAMREFRHALSSGERWNATDMALQKGQWAIDKLAEMIGVEVAGG